MADENTDDWEELDFSDAFDTGDGSSVGTDFGSAFDGSSPSNSMNQIDLGSNNSSTSGQYTQYDPNTGEGGQTFGSDPNAWNTQIDWGAVGTGLLNIGKSAVDAYGGITSANASNTNAASGAQNASTNAAAQANNALLTPSQIAVNTANAGAITSNAANDTRKTTSDIGVNAQNIVASKSTVKVNEARLLLDEAAQSFTQKKDVQNLNLLREDQRLKQATTVEDMAASGQKRSQSAITFSQSQAAARKKEGWAKALTRGIAQGLLSRSTNKSGVPALTGQSQGFTPPQTQGVQ